MESSELIKELTESKNAVSAATIYQVADILKTMQKEQVKFMNDYQRIADTIIYLSNGSEDNIKKMKKAEEELKALKWD
jgi:hypothetical protein